MDRDRIPNAGIEIGVAATHRGHPTQNGGIRRLLTGAVHDALESVSTITGIRTYALLVSPLKLLQR
jgi:hypothetical protein